MYQDCQTLTKERQQLKEIIRKFEHACVFKFVKWDELGKDYISICKYSGDLCKFSNNPSCVSLVMRYAKGDFENDFTRRL
jgi:hypothetical protein